MSHYNKDQNSSKSPDHLEEIDIKALFQQHLYLWPYLLAFMILGLAGAYSANYISPKIYQVSTVIQFKEQPNPFADLKSTITLKTKATSEKTESNIQVLKSYAHNEKVIKQLQLQVAYFSKNRFKGNQQQINPPYRIIWDSSHVQLVNQTFNTVINPNGTATVSVVAENTQLQLYDYNLAKRGSTSYPEYSFTQDVKLNEWVTQPYFKFKIVSNTLEKNQFEKLNKITQQPTPINLFFTFQTYEQIVTRIQHNLSVEQITDEAAIIKLKLIGENKSAMVNFLNTTVEVLKKGDLNEKNVMARNTIAFIDREIKGVHDTLVFLQHQLEVAQRDHKLIDLSTQANYLFEKYSSIDEKQSSLDAELDYLQYLQTNLNSSTPNFSSMVPPSMVGIEDPSLIGGVEKLVTLQMEKNHLQQDLKPSNPIILNLDIQIENAQAYLSKNLYNLIKVSEIQKDNLNSHKQKLESEFATLPSAEQSILNIKRKHNVIDAQYTFLMERRSEAGIVMAANVPDIRVVDVARDAGQGPISPKRQVNYMIGMMLGLFIPVSYAFLKYFFKNKVRNIQDVTSMIDAPIIGVIGHVNNLGMSDLQKDSSSILSESYRSLRTNCESIINKNRIDSNINGAPKKADGQVILITSLVQGEGKSLSTLNLGLSYANGGFKTIIVAADLRKQNMHKRMNLENNFGLSDYLQNKKEINEIVQTTETQNLDFIGSGPKSKNPGELVLSPKMNVIISQLREMYDFVIIDTPPIGLVADAKHLMPLSDINLHVIRQDFTRLNLIENLNQLYESHQLKNFHILLNDVSINHNNQYDYGMAYAYGYAYGEEYGNEYNSNHKYN